MHRFSLAFALFVAAGIAGCGSASPASHTRSSTWLAPIIRGSAPRRPPPLTARGGPAPTALVERALHERGFRFGTDGSTGALYAYMRNRHRSVRPTDARPGNVVFFIMQPRSRFVPASYEDHCGTHSGLVVAVDPDGRIVFREARNGEVRTSYAHPLDPRRRRDNEGRVLNTFLRPMRPDDPEEARYFAGEMLCAVIRPQAK